MRQLHRILEVQPQLLVRSHLVLQPGVALGGKLGQGVVLPAWEVWGFSVWGHFFNLPVDNFYLRVFPTKVSNLAASIGNW